MKLKLQELESALLTDNDVYEDVDMFGAGLSMEIDGEWSDPIRTDQSLHDSPKESSSSDSYHSASAATKRYHMLHLKFPSRCLFTVLLYYQKETLKKLCQMVSIQGDPHQRIATYMVEGLAALMAASGKYLYKALRCKEPPSSDRLAAMQILFEVCPCFKFGFMAANGAIIEAFKDEKRYIS
ncbi:hypothetical protein Goari_026929 [Gossypium aridum]|uniref:Uncharacterized protein n=1 Tax=Gossypium aridum TaxID=34290 RepID=A0A7J8YUC6_GOSAI|nr:hypothetical protein [Gossypium aridum]